VNKKAGHGHIDITIRQKNNLLECTIDDDGVGRQVNNSEQIEKPLNKTSIGTAITLQRIQQLQSTSYAGGVEIVDKMNHGQPAGTTVILTIPVKFQVHA
jgi:sensor histidine kinase YesM